MTVGWLTTIPYICRRIGLIGWGVDLRPDEGAALELFGACVVSTAGLLLAAADDGDVVGESSACRWLRWDSTARRARLGDAADVHVGGSRRGGDRLDQLDRQSRRLLRPHPRRLGPRRDREAYTGGLYAMPAAPSSPSSVSAFFLNIPNNVEAGVSRRLSPWQRPAE